MHSPGAEDVQTAAVILYDAIMRGEARHRRSESGGTCGCRPDTWLDSLGSVEGEVALLAGGLICLSWLVAGTVHIVYKSVEKDTI